VLPLLSVLGARALPPTDWHRGTRARGMLAPRHLAPWAPRGTTRERTIRASERSAS